MNLLVTAQLFICKALNKFRDNKLPTFFSEGKKMINSSLVNVGNHQNEKKIDVSVTHIIRSIELRRLISGPFHMS